MRVLNVKCRMEMGVLACGKKIAIYMFEPERNFKIGTPRRIMKGRSILRLSRTRFDWQRWGFGVLV
jgi:hypothetical protein